MSTFSHMADPVLKLLNGYNITNDRIRGVYAALTSDDVTRLPEWEELKRSAARRNKVAHEGRFVTQQEAEQSLRAATALVKHLGF